MVELTEEQMVDVDRWLGTQVWLIDNFNTMPIPWNRVIFGHSYTCPSCEHKVRWYMTGEIAKWACECQHTSNF